MVVLGTAGIKIGDSAVATVEDVFASFALFPDFSRFTFGFLIGGEGDMLGDAAEDDAVAIGGDDDNVTASPFGSSFLRLGARGGVAFEGASAAITSVTEAILQNGPLYQHGQKLEVRMMETKSGAGFGCFLANIMKIPKFAFRIRISP